MTFNDLLRQALAETAEERAVQMLKVEKKHRFSLAYKLWEHKTLCDLRRGKRNTRWTLKRAKAVVAAGFAACFLLVGGTAFAAISMGRYGFVDKRDYSKLLVERYPSDKTSFEEYYGLPEEDGWVLRNCDSTYAVTLLHYTRCEKSINFSQSLIYDGNMGNINTENADVEMLSLYAENDGFILVFRDNWCSIHWIYDGYLLNLDGNITKSKAINLALSTKVVEF